MTHTGQSPVKFSSLFVNLTFLQIKTIFHDSRSTLGNRCDNYMPGLSAIYC